MIEYEKRAMIEAEDKYTFRQSTQISMQTGLIGHLRADMDTDGNGFFSSWFDFREELKTDEFKAEFDEVINSLREEGDILHNRRALAKYCYCTPQSRMQEEPGYYGVRVDTEKYAYLLRLNPDRGEYNLYCYCYRRDWLDQHLKDAEKGIRFIDSHYKELFRIPDGGKVNIHYSWNEDQIRTCRYIDDYHVEIGSNLYHIGVALARELWGDRFQVVIATHCNTGHYHNHFVINSVSDVDGKKFYNSPADYRRMREVSDRLCREAKISVIEYPADRRANYGEWLAEKNGKPTMRNRIREDIDRAILASTTEREFQRVMKEMGYEVITRTPKGSPRVHPIVRIVDGGKNFRLDKLGDYYELDSIKQRIQNNYRRKTPFPEVAEDTKAPYYQYKEKAKKASGLYALYLYYCYELHIIVHKPASVKKVSAFLREDVTKLDRYIAQADFLAKTGIETVEALAGYKVEKEKQVEALTQQRAGLKNELKRHIRKEDFQSAEATRARIAELTAELKTCRKDIVLCSDIADRSEQVRKNLEQIEQQKIERKEKAENELLVRRSSRAGREDDTQRR